MHQKENSNVVIGTCTDMCPLYQVKQRELQRDLSLFELKIISPTPNSLLTSGFELVANEQRCVKKYERSAAEKSTPPPHHIRTIETLHRTMNYLIDEIVDLTKWKFPCLFSAAKNVVDTKNGNVDCEKLTSSSVVAVPTTVQAVSFQKEIYEFLRDRIRSIAQDLTYQNVRNDRSIELHEQFVRFHIMCQHELLLQTEQTEQTEKHKQKQTLKKKKAITLKKSGKKSRNDDEQFDEHFDETFTDDNVAVVIDLQPNLNLLNNYLKNLVEMYCESHVRNSCGSVSMTAMMMKNNENEPEFICYYILTRLSSKHGQSEIVRLLRQLPPSVYRSNQVKFALEMCTLVENQNWRQFFKRVQSEKTSYLQSCALNHLFVDMRQVALKSMNATLNVKSNPKKEMFPVGELTEMLCFDTERDTIDFCKLHGVCVHGDDEHVIFNESTFSYPSTLPKPTFSHRIVHQKRLGLKYSQIIRGCCSESGGSDSTQQQQQSNKASTTTKPTTTVIQQSMQSMTLSEEAIEKVSRHRSSDNNTNKETTTNGQQKQQQQQQTKNSSKKKKRRNSKNKNDTVVA